MPEIWMRALSQVLEPNIFLIIMAGVLAGMVVGALPGLTATMSVGILVGLTFGLHPLQGLSMLIGIYCGAIYGGSISAILINIPGTPASAASCADGYALSQKGRAGPTLGLAAVLSFVGGTISVVILVIFAPLIARVTLKFSPVEYTMLALFGLSIIAYVSGKSLVKGLVSGLLGIFLKCWGIDPIYGYPRFTFGQTELVGGVEFIPVMIGAFGLAEVIFQLKAKEYKIGIIQKITNVFPKLSVLRKQAFNVVRSAIIGTFVGALPGAGCDIAAWVAYGEAKRASKHSDKFGTGVIEGIAAPTTANNAATGGAMIPMLTLGIPGDSVTAILIGALMIHGLRPGPLLFRQHPDLVYGLFIAMFLANLLFLIFGLAGARIFPKVIATPKNVLMPIIVVLCCVGSYAMRNSIFDIYVMFAFGIIGYFMRRADFPVAPLVLGMILGPIAESNMRRALLISGGNPWVFFTRPISATLLILIIIFLMSPYLRKFFPLGRQPK